MPGAGQQAVLVQKKDGSVWGLLAEWASIYLAMAQANRARWQVPAPEEVREAPRHHGRTAIILILALLVLAFAAVFWSRRNQRIPVKQVEPLREKSLLNIPHLTLS